MQASQTGKDLIKKYEGLRLKAYVCPGGRWTIGYGQTGPDVYEGLEIDEQTANNLLWKALPGYEDAINELVKVPLNQNQFDSLVSFTYNIGIEAFKKSTLLKMINSGDMVGASYQFLIWIYSGHKILRGLVERRKAEKDLFTKKGS